MPEEAGASWYGNGGALPLALTARKRQVSNAREVMPCDRR